jgi:TrpR-related protein YerC/YecD
MANQTDAIPPRAATAPAPKAPASGEDRWMSDATRELGAAVAVLRDGEEALRFLRDLCTVNELREFAARWEVARLLDAGTSYHEISARTGASSATISRVNQWLRYGRDGYRLVLDRQARSRRRRR